MGRVGLLVLLLVACAGPKASGPKSGVLDLSPSTSTWMRVAATGELLSAPAIYELTAGHEDELDWELAAEAPWLTADSESGVLAPRASLPITLSPRPEAIGALGPGRHTARFTIRSRTNPGRRVERTVVVVVEGKAGEEVSFQEDDPPAGTADGTADGSQEPRALSEPEARLQRTIQRFGIAWSFDERPVQGTFANGDPWVVGPVRITAIRPHTKTSGGRTLNGSMVNPSPRNGWTQGYDSACYGKYKGDSAFDPELNVADGISSESPLVLRPHTSLVSTRSIAKAGARPQVASAAILTVLPEKPPEGAFRPPYSGKRKDIRFRESDLDYDKLAELAPVPSTPSWRRVERMFERPWLDHVPGWIGRYIHPKESMPDYGREMTDWVGQASLMLHLDVPAEKKRDLLVSFVQLGIDFYGILEDGGRNNWQAGDGHHSGRKWPILFAGLMLNDPEMSGIGLDPDLLFMGEDGQTFYVEHDGGGVYNGGHGNYDKRHVGMAEWGKKHALRPSFDNARWDADPYRTCCTANTWWGQLLACRIMGVVELWNHPALFDYQDRYLKMISAGDYPGWVLSWSPFPIEMWRRYRSRF